MRFVAFTNSDGHAVLINAESVESIKQTDAEWLKSVKDYEGPFTDIRCMSGQIVMVRSDLKEVEQRLRYGDT